MRKPIARSINGVVFSLSTPRRHGNSKSSDFLKESGLDLSRPKISQGTIVPSGIKGNSSHLIITD